MAIYVNLNVVMAQRRISSQELAAQVGITQANLSILKTGKPRPFASAPWTPFVKLWTVSPATFWNTARRNPNEIQPL